MFFLIDCGGSNQIDDNVKGPWKLPCNSSKCDLFDQVVKRAGNSYYFIGILAVGLAAVIGVGVICVICAVVKMRKRSAASGKGPSNLF